MRPFVVVAGSLLVITAVPYLAFIGLYIWLRPSGSPADKREWEPPVSIVIPTYNEEAIVEMKLEDLLKIDYPMEKVELVIIDSSTDATREIIREYFTDLDAPKLVLLEEDGRSGVASAINQAMDTVSSEVVFRTDCDSKLGSDVLREAVANLSDGRIGAVTGQQTDVLGESQVEQDYRDIIARIQAVESHLDSTFICHGPCFAFRRSSFQTIASDSLADDTEIGVKVRRAGDRVIMDPALRFVESGVSEFSRRRTRKDRRAMGLIQLLVRNRDVLDGLGQYSRVIFPFNWWLMIVSPWLSVLTTVAAIAAAVSVFGTAGMVAPFVLVAFFWLGQRDTLGPVQPLYAVADSQVSLLVAQVRLALSDVTGTWDVDRESRQMFE
jgi:cellulose synthase/poly-beta-1,6-N-acetylglucosamine synthase-like glycosyltransferase